jgi:putative ABC transport system substrate-binding protein
LKRREFLRLIGGSAAAWPLTAHSQQPDRMRRIGVLVSLEEDDAEGQRWVKAFTQSLTELGWKSGTNVRFDFRWASDRKKMRICAKELVELRPDLILVTTTPATAEVLQETQSIPVVFTVVSDPVGSGFVQSLSRPGRNATGFINMESSLGGKWMGLLREIAPDVTRVVMMFNPETAPQAAYYRGPLEAAAASLDITVEAAPVRETAQIEMTIAALGQDRKAGLIVLPDIFSTSHRVPIISMTARHRVIAIYWAEIFARDGGLVSYGVDLTDLQRRAASYVDRILKGATPSDLPTQLPTKFEFVINLKTAKALDLTVPASMLARADELIE